MPDPSAAAGLRRSALLAIVAWLLLIGAGLRHNLVWGEDQRWPWLLPLLNSAQAACLVGFTALAGWSWSRATRLGASGALDSRSLTRWTVVILIAAILVPLTATMDPIDYVMRGRIVALHGGNPYVQVATDYPHDPFVGFGDAAWKSFPLPYGPLVAWLQAGVAWLADCLPLVPRAQLLVAVGLFKAVFAAAVLATAWLLREVARAAGRADADAVFVGVAWNPLLLFEGVANAHNEPLVMMCVAGAVAAAAAGHHGRAAFAVGVGTLTKAAPVMLAPLWAAFAVRRGRTGPMLGGVAATLAVAALAWWHFFRADGSFEVVRRQTALVGTGAYQVLHLLTGLPVPELLFAGRIFVVGWLVWMTVRVWRRPALDQLVVAAATSLFLVAVLGTTLNGPWYHAWWIPLALWIGHGWLARFARVLSVVAPLAYLGWFGWRSYDAVTNWIGACFFLLVPCVLACVRWPQSVAPRRSA